MPKAERRPFQYKERSQDDVRERANRSAGGYDSYINSRYKRYKSREGKNSIRILPPTWKDANHWGYDIYTNFGIGVDNQSYLSLSMMASNHPELGLDGRDPIAEARRAAERSEDEELVKQLKPRPRVLLWVIDRLDEDEGPQLYDAPFTLDQDFVRLCQDDETKSVIYADRVEDGYDITFHKEGKGLSTKYPGSKMRLKGPNPLHEDPKIEDKWLEFITDNPVPSCLVIYDYDHIANVFNGKVSKRDEEVDARPSRAPRKADDDDEVPPRGKAPPPDDDEDEEPAPRSSKATRQRAEPADDDADDDVAPKPRRRVPVAKDDDEEAAPAPRQSLADRLKAARAKADAEEAD